MRAAAERELEALNAEQQMYEATAEQRSLQIEHAQRQVESAEQRVKSLARGTCSAQATGSRGGGASLLKDRELSLQMRTHSLKLLRKRQNGWLGGEPVLTVLPRNLFDPVTLWIRRTRSESACGNNLRR